MDASLEGRELYEAKKNLLDAGANPDYKHLTLKIKTTTANETVTIPITNTNGLTIDWGIGGGPESVASSNPNKVYPTPNEYIVKVIGTVPANTSVGDNTYNYTNVNIVELIYWGENGFKEFRHFGKNLRGSIPTPSKESFKNTTRFYSVFRDSVEITGPIPHNLFILATKVTEFTTLFTGCSKLEGSIPPLLFANCPLANNFPSLFSGCAKLTGIIPPKLFDNSPDTILSLYSCFKGCVGLTGEAPSNIFNKNVQTKGMCFSGCTGLSNFTTLPSAWK